MQFLKATLENGLEVVAECNPQAWSTALGFFVKTGARDEADGVSGVSHFLEHMAFKGSATRSGDDIDRQFDEMGAHHNACTGEEHTIYHAAMLPECQDRAVELLADILRPALRPADFDVEKKVILEEIHMYEDSPPFGADEKCKAAYFGPHPLGRSILGTAQSITALSVEAMREYFRRRYSPGNVVLVGAGKVDFEALVAAARRWCGGWEPAPCGRAVEPCAPRSGFHVLGKESATQQYVMQLAGGPSAEDPQRYPAKLLATAVGDETGSRLFWELVDPGLAESATLHHVEYEGAGVFMTYMSCDPDRAAHNLQRTLDLYRQVQRDGITAEELARAKSKLSSRVVLAGERPRSRLFAVGSEWTQCREYRSVQDDLATVASISLDDIAAVLARYPLTRNTTMAIGPLAELPAPA